MVTTKILLAERFEKEGGLFNVKLRVTHKRRQYYLSLGHSLTLKDWNKMNSGRPGDKLKDVLLDLQEQERKARDIASKLPVFSFSLFKKKFKNITDVHSLTGAFDAYVAELKKQNRIGSMYNYINAKNSLNRYSEGTLLTEVTPEFLRGYEEWMGDKITTLRLNLRMLRCVINKAISDGTFQQAHYPFGRHKYKFPPAKVRRLALNEPDIAKIYYYKGEYERARDYWWFMYEATGMNAGDMYKLKYENIKNDKIIYRRSKTGKNIEVLLTKDLRRIIDDYGSGKEFIFGAPHADAIGEKKAINNFIGVLNDHMRKVADDLGIAAPVTTYSTRHSAVTMLKRGGTPISVIAEMVGHDEKMTEKFYADRYEDDMKRKHAAKLTAFKNKSSKVVKFRSA